MLSLTLISHTPDPLTVILSAARLCYTGYTPTELTERVKAGEYGAEKDARLLHELYLSGHHSVFEHVSFTFGVSGLSRVSSHQLVRHRVATYSQQSQRYVKQGGTVVRPPSIEKSGAVSVFEKTADFSREAYRQLVEMGVPAEDARYILPHGCETNIIFTMNARELLHFLSLRLCRRAQWEIRDLSLMMLDKVNGVLPEVFRYAGPPCYVDGKCPEPPKRSCGEPWTRTEVK